MQRGRQIDATHANPCRVFSHAGRKQPPDPPLTNTNLLTSEGLDLPDLCDRGLFHSMTTFSLE